MLVYFFMEFDLIDSVMLYSKGHKVIFYYDLNLVAFGKVILKEFVKEIILLLF